MEAVLVSWSKGRTRTNDYSFSHGPLPPWASYAPPPFAPPPFAQSFPQQPYGQPFSQPPYAQPPPYGYPYAMMQPFPNHLAPFGAMLPFQQTQPHPAPHRGPLGASRP